MALTLKISVAIITFNEEKNILDCLNSLPKVDEILVVDSYSNDQTKDICRKFGTKVISRKFKGHIEQKQFAVDSCKNNWIFSIDADERFSEELRENLYRLFNDSPSCFGYRVNRKNFHLGRWIRRGGWYPDARIRFFCRKHGKWGGHNPHDQFSVNGKVGKLDGDLIHYTFQNLSHNIQTNDRYSSIMAENLYQKGIKSSYFKLLVKPAWKFFEEYILKLGFLDKTPGLIIAIGSSYSMFLKQAKLWEKHHKEKKQSSELESN